MELEPYAEDSGEGGVSVSARDGTRHRRRPATSSMVKNQWSPSWTSSPNSTRLGWCSPCEQAELALEAQKRPRGRRGRSLERAPLALLAVERLVHRPHPALPQRVDDLEPRRAGEPQASNLRPGAGSLSSRFGESARPGVAVAGDAVGRHAAEGDGHAPPDGAPRERRRQSRIMNAMNADLAQWTTRERTGTRRWWRRRSRCRPWGCGPTPCRRWPGPAMSTCTQGVSPTNSLRNSPAVRAPP